MLHVGFTGTQRGMTPEQKAKVCEIFDGLAPFYAHHGDCVGADAEFHELCLAGRRCFGITIHPPTNERLRAFCKAQGPVSVTWAPEAPYLERNRDIAISGVDLLIATPKERNREVVRSGTWSTVRYARELGRAISIVWPGGGVFATGAHGR